MRSIILESAVVAPVTVRRADAKGLEFITVLQSADTKNRNGRIYSKKILEDAINSPYIRERLETKTLYSEIGHPLDTSVARQMTIDQRNVGCIIEDIWWEGNLLKARCETTNTTVGKDLRGLIEQGCKIAFSLRAQGKVHNDPVTQAIIVEGPLQICTWDVVVTPSHAEAFMEKICEETVQALYHTSKSMLNESLLLEAEDIFTNGALYDPNNEIDPKELDYTKNYTTKLTKVEDLYIPDENDTVVTMNPDVTVLRNEEDNVIKKVLTEDYIVKDIRSKILKMF